MSYGMYRTGDNRPDTEGREIDKTLALKSIAESLERIAIILEEFLKRK